MTAVKYRNWLNALCQFCEAQSLVLSAARESASYSDLISSLCQSSSMVHNAIMFLKVDLYSKLLDNPFERTINFPNLIIALLYWWCWFPTQLQASDPPSLFGIQFLSVHASWLSTHSQLLATCVSLSTMPPPSSDLSRSTEKKVPFDTCISICMVNYKHCSAVHSSIPIPLIYSFKNAYLSSSCWVRCMINSTLLCLMPIPPPSNMLHCIQNYIYMG